MRYLGPDPTCPHRRVHWSAPHLVQSREPPRATVRMRGQCLDCGLRLKRTGVAQLGPVEVDDPRGSPSPPDPHRRDSAA